MRYTEADDSLAAELLADIDKEMDFVLATTSPGWSLSFFRPEFKPPHQRFLRHCSGYGDNIPTHNLGEVVDALLK